MMLYRNDSLYIFALRLSCAVFSRAVRQSSAAVIRRAFTRVLYLTRSPRTADVPFQPVLQSLRLHDDDDVVVFRPPLFSVSFTIIPVRSFAAYYKTTFYYVDSFKIHFIFSSSSRSLHLQIQYFMERWLAHTRRGIQIVLPKVAPRTRNWKQHRTLATTIATSWQQQWHR